MKLSEDARAFLRLLITSRVEETPTRRSRPRQYRSSTNYALPLKMHQRCLPIVPVSSTSGVSRDDMLGRLRQWGVEWTLERVTAVVKELEVAGFEEFGIAVLVKGPRGYFVSAEWSKVLHPVTDAQRERLKEAFVAVGNEHGSTQASVMMLHATRSPFRLDYTPMDVVDVLSLLESIDAVAALLDALRQVIAP